MLFRKYNTIMRYAYFIHGSVKRINKMKSMWRLEPMVVVVALGWAMFHQWVNLCIRLNQLTYVPRIRNIERNSRHSTLFSLLFRSMLWKVSETFFSFNFSTLFSVFFLFQIAVRKNTNTFTQHARIPKRYWEPNFFEFYTNLKNNNFSVLVLWQQWRRTSFHFFFYLYFFSPTHFLTSQSFPISASIQYAISMIYNSNLHQFCFLSLRFIVV